MTKQRKKTNPTPSPLVEKVPRQQAVEAALVPPLGAEGAGPFVYMTTTHDVLTIYIDHHIHLQLDLEHLRGFQSYTRGSNVNGHYHIDFYTNAQVIETSYVSRTLWLDILRQLDTAKIFSS